MSAVGEAVGWSEWRTSIHPVRSLEPRRTSCAPWKASALNGMARCSSSPNGMAGTRRFLAFSKRKEPSIPVDARGRTGRVKRITPALVEPDCPQVGTPDWIDLPCPASGGNGQTDTGEARLTIRRTWGISLCCERMGIGPTNWPSWWMTGIRESTRSSGVPTCWTAHRSSWTCGPSWITPKKSALDLNLVTCPSSRLEGGKS